MTLQEEFNSSEPNESLIFAFALDGNGGGREIGWADLETPRTGAETIWIHLNYGNNEAREWLIQESGLDELTSSALLATDPRPRSLAHGDGLLLILRGVNMNPASEPDDMVSLRLWLEPNRIISIRNRRIMAVADLAEATQNRRGPRATSDFLEKLIGNLLSRMEEVVADLDEQVDELEEKVVAEQTNSIRVEISQLRRMAIGLRRYIAPQRQAMSRLVTEEVDWFTQKTRDHLREYSDRLMRCVEDIDSAHERARVTHEELNSQISERMNATMCLISVFTVIFLPLGMLTGLLGINVGGMPGVNDDAAFYVVCALMAIMAVVLTIVLKMKKWL